MKDDIVSEPLLLFLWTDRSKCRGIPSNSTLLADSSKSSETWGALTYHGLLHLYYLVLVLFLEGARGRCSIYHVAVLNWVTELENQRYSTVNSFHTRDQVD